MFDLSIVIPTFNRAEAGPSAYVKVADGCDHNCAFCTIPSIKGRQVSKRPLHVIQEIERASNEDACAGVAAVIVSAPIAVGFVVNSEGFDFDRAVCFEVFEQLCAGWKRDRVHQRQRKAETRIADMARIGKHRNAAHNEPGGQPQSQPKQQHYSGNGHEANSEDSPSVQWFRFDRLNISIPEYKPAYEKNQPQALPPAQFHHCSGCQAACLVQFGYRRESLRETEGTRASYASDAQYPQGFYGVTTKKPIHDPTNFDFRWNSGCCQRENSSISNHLQNETQISLVINHAM